MRPIAFLAATLALTSLCGAKNTKSPSTTKNASANVLALEKKLEVVGELKGDHDLSGVALVDDWVVFVSDETDHVALMKRQGDRLHVVATLTLRAGAEIDLEAAAAEGKTVYVAGSHSATRKVRVKNTYAKNRAILAEVRSEPARDAIYRFTLDADGKPSRPDKISLRAIIDKDPILKPFVPLAAKENGIDIEGLAVRDGWLYAGFRGPVLAIDNTPILKFRFDAPERTAELLFVALGGLGVRDMTRVQDGFLILAGPAGSVGPFRIYHWDGKDCLIGERTDGQAGRCLCLTDVPETQSGKPEGLAVLQETATDYEILLVTDGVKNGQPTIYRLPKRK